MWSIIRTLLVPVFLSFLFTDIVAPPVDQKKAENGDEDSAFFNLEYEAYLQEVVQVLEADPEFRSKLEKANPDDVKSGKIAEELDFLHHDVRSKLHEIKRREVDRLRQALREQMELELGIDNLVMPGHLDHENVDTFEQEDLRKLILKTTKDLEELDVKRREEYKEYEMEKELEFRQQLANMTEEERLNVTKEKEAKEKRHEKHPDLKHPGSKAQLEEVWEKVDHLSKDNFDPKTFFKLHDLTGDGVLDISELEALFQKELDKVYDKNNSDDDMKQRDEEMARMREHVLREVDENKDGVISLDEFLADASKPDFKEDEGWETVDKKKTYSEDDLKVFAEEWAKENGVPVPQLYPPYGGYPSQQQPPYQQAGFQPHGQYPNQPIPQYPNQQVPQYQQQQQMVGQPVYGQQQQHWQGPGVPQGQVGVNQGQFANYGQGQAPYQQQPYQQQQQQQPPPPPPQMQAPNQAQFNQQPVQQPPPGQVPVQQQYIPQGQPQFQQQPVQGQQQVQQQPVPGQAQVPQQPIPGNPQVQVPQQQQAASGPGNVQGMPSMGDYESRKAAPAA